MPNPYHKCPDCGLNHRPLNCRKGGVGSLCPVPGGSVAPEGASSPSRVILTVDVTPVTAILDAISGKLDVLIEKFAANNQPE